MTKRFHFVVKSGKCAVIGSAVHNGGSNAGRSLDTRKKESQVLKGGGSLNESVNARGEGSG